MKFRREELLPEVVNILEALLNYSEQPERKQVVRLRLNRRSHHWYFSMEEIGLRQRVFAQLQELERVGWLKLHWHKYEEGNQLEAIDLIATPEQYEALYALLKRVPGNILRASLYNLLRAESGEGWYGTFLAWARAQLDANKSPAPLDPEDPQGCLDLLHALSAISNLQSPILERTLSIQLFHDSKRLEKLRPATLSVLRTHTPDASAYGDDDRALLQAHNIYRVPEYIYLTGPLTLSLQAAGSATEPARLELQPQLPSIGLAEDVLPTAQILECPATALITVENLTSFRELLFVRPRSSISIFSSGFASPGLITLLTRLRAQRPDLPLYHWGDLDAGGLRILAHLRRHLGPVHPLCMNAEILASHQSHTRPLTSNDKTGLQILRQDPILTDCAELIDAMLTSSTKLEQEAISATEALAHIHTIK